MTTDSPESPAAHRVVVGPIPALEDPLFASLAAIQRSDPLRGVTVVVASNLLGVHLRRRYVEWREERGLSAAHAGIAFPTLASFAEEAAGPGPPPLPPFGAFALLCDALARLPEARVFGDLAARPELVPSLEATIRDLADAGVSGKAFRSFVESAPLAPERRLLLGAVARFFEAIERGSAGHEPPWRLYRRAGTAARSGPTEPVLLYGFYDATGVQQEFLASLSRRRPLLAFVPRPSGRHGTFADRFLAWLGATLATPEEMVHEPPASPLARFRVRLGEGAGPGEETGDAVHLVSAASAAGERTEIAREIVMAAEAGIPLHRIGVIARETGARTNALSRELLRLGIPNFEYGPPAFASSPAGRALRLWWDLEEEDFRREDVLAVLDLLAADRAVPVAAARSIARQAGIVRGARSWGERLFVLERAARSPAAASAARALAAACEGLVASASGWPQAPRSWNEWSTELRRRLETLYAPERPPAGVVSAAEALAALDELGGPVERPAAGHVFFAALAEQGENSGRLGVDGVFIGSAMASRGLTFAMTIVSGLIEREFPETGRPDPLFFDVERAALARATKRSVPLKTERRPAEERQLFGMAVGSAIERLVCTTARRDEAFARDTLPSPFFADADGAAAAGGVSSARRTHLGVAVPEGPSLSAAEALDRALQRFGPATVALAYPPLGRARERIALSGSPRWSAFEGRLGSAARSALARHRLEGDRAISASAIEMFATCSYRYFFRRVLRLNEWEEAERVSELDPLRLGKAFHDAARRVVASGGVWPPDPSASLAARASEESIRAVEQEVGPIAPDLLRELAVRRLEALVREWLRFEAARSGGPRPFRAEVEFGAEDSPLIFDTGAFPVRLHGFIDRIDADAAGNPARVLDYKVRFATKFRDEFGGEGRILGGEASQLAVYAVAAGAPVEAEYLYLMAADGAAPQAAAVSRTPEQTGEAIAALRTLLIGMDRAIASGTFLPRTEGRLRKDLCAYCAYLSVCGPGHVSRFDAKESDPDPEARALRRLQDLP